MLRDERAMVVVIGAGAAGLAAARTLAASGSRVAVLEARDRIGGRAWCLPSSRTAVAVELGAEFIHGRARETVALLREIGGASYETTGDSWVYAGGALRQDDDDMIAAAALFEKAVALEPDVSVDRFLEPYEADERTRAAAAGARAFVEGFEAADPARASTVAIAREWASGVDARSARPVGGYGALFAHLQNACVAGGVELHLGTTVRRIDWRRGDVTIEATDARGAMRRFHARAAIVTLPVGVLQDKRNDAVTFDPALSERKREALEHMAMGEVFKVVLSFRSAFWERLDDERYRDAAFFRHDGGPFTAYWTQYPLRGEIITAWAGGPRARALGGTPERDLIARACDGFGALFGDVARARAEFERGRVHDWSADPFARGAYSYVTTGGGDARAILAEAVEDTLFFAGEATSADGQGGTVNGALHTGNRAALQALKAGLD